jgi:hypothetical protein
LYWSLDLNRWLSAQNVAVGAAPALAGWWRSAPPPAQAGGWHVPYPLCEARAEECL